MSLPVFSEEEILIIRQAQNLFENVINPRIDACARSFAQKCGLDAKGKVLSSYTPTEELIKNFFTSKAYTQPLATIEVLEQMSCNEKRPKYEHLPTGIYDRGALYPSLRDNEVFKEFFSSVYNQSIKGLGKGELLLTILFSDVVKGNGSDDHTIGSYSEETKTDKATCKGNEKSSYRIIDALNEEYGLKKQIGYTKSGRPQYENRCIWHIDNKKEVRSYFQKLGNITVELDSLLKVWDNNTPEQRKQLIGCRIFRKYQAIGGWRYYTHYHENKKTGEIKIAIIKEFDDDTLLRYLKFSPQTMRRGCTQAVGDGYTDTQVNKRSIK